MRLNIATGYGSSEIAGLMLAPKPEATGRALPDNPVLLGKPQLVTTVVPRPGASSTSSGLLALNADIRREARNELWTLVILWMAAWTALALLGV